MCDIYSHALLRAPNIMVKQPDGFSGVYIHFILQHLAHYDDFFVDFILYFVQNI